MGLQIEDGHGRGFLARVSEDGNFIVDAITAPEIAHISIVHGRSYAWASGTYSASGADTILLVKNIATSYNLFISEISVSANVDTRVVIHLPTVEVTPTGTSITGTNLNTGSNNTADATAIRDETNNTQGTVIWSGEIQAASDPYRIPLFGAVIIGQNDSIAIDFVAAATACDVVIYGSFE